MATTTQHAFSRDRERLLFLCTEMIQRIGEESNPNSIGAIEPLAQEMEETDLAIKLGFPANPVVFTHRAQSGFGRVDYLISNDPFGSKHEEIVLSLVNSAKDPGSQEQRSPNQLDQTENRARVLKSLRAWERAIEGLQEHAVYPVMPSWIAPGVEHRLWADPFWRALHELIRQLRMKPQDPFANYHAQKVEVLVGKINRLARESGLPSRVVFLQDGVSILVHGPEGGPAAVFEPNSLTKLSDETAGSREKIILLLSAWQDRRAASLFPAGLDPLAPEKSDAPSAQIRRVALPPLTPPGGEESMDPEGTDAASGAPIIVAPDGDSRAGYFSTSDLATKFGVNADALRKRMDRWRKKNSGGAAFIQNTERSSREPEFLYSLKAALPAIQALKGSVDASDLASSKRPASRKPKP